MKFEQPSVNEIFENRKEYIPEVGEIFQREAKQEIEINGKKLNVDYRIVSVKEKERKDADPVILLSGFGSGWEGISELAFSLACEGREVVVVSLPGFGNSDNPPKEYYETDDFATESQAIEKLVSSFPEFEGRKFHLIGHSMGNEILAEFAQRQPDKTSSFVLLNAGANEKNVVSFSGNFLMDGAKTNAECFLRSSFSGEKDYEKGLREFVPRAKSSFSRERLKQRASEFNRLKESKFFEKVKDINVPITFISGELDMVFPANEQLEKLIKASEGNPKIEKSIMHGLRHNTTIAPDEITAANIEHYLEKAEIEKSSE